uniref:Uncharacterized protein n=1 Tax=Eutreptiella gymnastica TaxID=73025 RepID=A0A6T1XX17_9EUGL|mmetsp:Transcript_1319/g.2230  ORF Transcript_1319/g.2230 Transcript_1319/m.2230 type:complete len:110 (+) Transcript_1319:178-507(+)
MCLVDWLSDPPPQRPHWPFYTPPPISDPPVHATPRPLQSLCWPLAPVVHAGMHNGRKGKAWAGWHMGVLCALKGSGQDEPQNSQRCKRGLEPGFCVPPLPPQLVQLFGG